MDEDRVNAPYPGVASCQSLQVYTPRAALDAAAVVALLRMVRFRSNLACKSGYGVPDAAGRFFTINVPSAA